MEPARGVQARPPVTARGTTRAGEKRNHPGTMRNQPEKPPVMRVRGENAPNTVDLTPKLQNLSRPRVPVRRVAAAGCCSDQGEGPEHIRECPGEARARRGGPIHRRSTTQEKDPKSTNTGTAERRRWKQAGVAEGGTRER